MKIYVLPATVALGPYPPPNTFPIDDVNELDPVDSIQWSGIIVPPRITTFTVASLFAAVILGSILPSLGVLSMVTLVPPTIE